MELTSSTRGNGPDNTQGNASTSEFNDALPPRAVGPISWIRSKTAGVLSDVLDHAGLAEPAGNLLDWLGGAVASVPGAEQYSSSGSVCLICLESTPTFATLQCEGHALCTSCAVSYVRSALGDSAAQVHAAGIKCPMHGGSGGCDGFISSVDAVRLLKERDARRLARQEQRGRPGYVREHPTLAVELGRQLSPPTQAARRGNAAWSQRYLLSPLQMFAARAMTASLGPPQLSAEALSIDEVHRLQRFMMEAVIPAHLRVWCPRCHLLLEKAEAVRDIVASHRSSAIHRSIMWLATRWRGASTRTRSLVSCPHCAHQWDPRRDAPDARCGQGDRTFDERASAAFIDLTSKRCPNQQCDQRISHFHGHACHHIAPSTDGCPACHQHFCYVCLRKHGRPGGNGYSRNPLCPHGSSFCKNERIAENLVLLPYPHDRRCGCPICMLCQVWARSSK